MNAHIITIGDEILIGQTLNTNAAYIGEKLVDMQVYVKKSSVVADDKEEVLKEFKECWDNNDLIIVTGGLGPTHDDITRQCIVKFFNTELIESKEVLEDINTQFTKKKREITKINEGQALVPKIATVIRNSRGTAPGFWIEKRNKIFIAMPGVPFEMKEMMENFVIPELMEKLVNVEFVSLRKSLQTTGIPESRLFEKLGNLTELLEGARLAFLPNQFGVKLRITADEKSMEEAQNKLTQVEQRIRSKVGRYIFSREEELLEEVVARLLKERGLTISSAESCTGGGLGNILTNVSGSSVFFERGIVAYSNAAKVENLGVNEETITEHGAVSLEVARQMAEGVRSISGTDLGVSTTGIMGPTGATTGKPVGLVYIGLCDENVCTAKEFIFGDDRLINKQRTIQAALDMIRRHLLGISLDD
ncbi:MAG TPA: competence/damage-inducible protein A [Ignavibacteriaceae bacterium]|nr:competence/damage-inducible protein A [Ignavibacteriaceae bacterium]